MSQTVSGFAAALLIIATSFVSADDGPLESDLRALEGLRNGLKTPADRVETEGQSLLDKYPERGQQALIHYTMAHIHAQSGQRRPDLVIEHADAALKGPLDPPRRLQLYIYSGDALQGINRVRKDGEQLPFEKIREMAARVYLQGLQEATQYNLPREKPELPALESPPTPKGSGAEYEADVKRFREINAANVAEMERVRQIQTLWDNRKILGGQVVDLYSRKPQAPDEVRSLVQEILGEAAAADPLLAAVADNPLRRTVPEVKSDPPPPPPPRRILVPLLITVNIVVLAALGGWWIARTRRNTRPR